MKPSILTLALVAAVTAAPAFSQKLGAGGTAIDGSRKIPQCHTPIGTIALVQEKKQVQQQLLPQFQALMEMASQQSGAANNVDPLPLVKVLINQSQCFYIVERGAGFDAIQRERALAGNSATAPALQPAKYLLTAEVVYQDRRAGGSMGGLGGLAGAFAGGTGFKVNNLETQVLLTLVEVDTGMQRAIASGAARKRDIGLLGAGLLGAGAAALTGYESTDISKITAAAILDAFVKLMPSIEVLQPAPQPALAPAQNSAVGEQSEHQGPAQ